MKNPRIVLALGLMLITQIALAMDAKDYKKFSKQFRDDVNYEDFSEDDIDDINEALDEEYASSLEDLTSESEDFIKRKRVRYSDIKSWQWLGDRYALGLGESGEALAVYDLSWPQVFSFSHFSRTLLGSVGVGEINLAKLVEIIRAALSRKDDDNFLASVNGSKVEKALRSLERDYGALKDEMPEGWWKKVKWKNELIGLSDEAPARFFLSDMDLAGMSRRPDHFARVEQKSMERLNEFLELDIKRSLFDHFELVKRTEGKGYDLYFVLPERDYVSKDLSLRPKKVADIRNPSKSFVRTFGLIAVEQAIGQVLSMIPVPIVSSLLDVAVGRWFNLMEQQEEAHHSFTLEVIDQTYAGISTPFSSLDENSIQAVANYLVAQDSAWYKAIFKSKGDDYRRYVEKRDQTNQKSLSWLEDKGWQSTMLAPWFALSEKDGKKRLFMLNEQYRLSRHPLTGMNYQNPDWELVWRHFVEAGDVAIDLIPIPVPFASTALGLIYSYFLQDPIENGQTQEARFRAWIGVRGNGEYGEEAKHMLARRLNPFELSPDEEAQLIAKRRAFLGL